jgi:hypothetical protein
MLIDTIRIIISDLVAKSQMFTAYDITLLARKDGAWVPHREAKPLVHDLMQNEFNGVYSGTPRTFGFSAWPALVYAPFGADVNDYDPLAVKNALATVPIPVASAPDPVTVVAVTTTFAQAPLKFDGKEIIVGTSNRIRIPADSIRDLGLKAGDKAFIAVETDGKMTISASQPVGKDAKSYTVDEYDNIGLRYPIVGVEKLKVGKDGARIVLTVAS